MVKAQNLSGTLIIGRNLVDVSKFFYFTNEPNFMHKRYALILKYVLKPLRNNLLHILLQPVICPRLDRKISLHLVFHLEDRPSIKSPNQ